MKARKTASVFFALVVVGILVFTRFYFIQGQINDHWFSHNDPILSQYPAIEAALIGSSSYSVSNSSGKIEDVPYLIGTVTNGSHQELKALVFDLVVRDTNTPWVDAVKERAWMIVKVFNGEATKFDVEVSRSNPQNTDVFECLKRHPEYRWYGEFITAIPSDANEKALSKYYKVKTIWNESR